MKNLAVTGGLYFLSVGPVSERDAINKETM
jgi:hypothetical protein